MHEAKRSFKYLVITERGIYRAVSVDTLKGILIQKI